MRRCLAVTLFAASLAGCSSMSDDATSLDAAGGAAGQGPDNGGAAGATVVAGGGGNGPANGGSGGAGARPTTMSGSFDLHMTGVTASVVMGPKAAASPAEGATFRLDLPAILASNATSGGKWRAVVTPLWGAPTAFDVTAADGAFTLSGSAVIPNSDDSVEDYVKSIVLARDASGALTGAASISGQEVVLSGDQGFSGALTATGVLGDDVTPPEARADVAVGFGPSGQALPWVSLGVDLSEPLMLDTTITSFRVAGADGTVVPVTWAAAGQTDDTKSSGISQILGSVSNWDGVPAQAIFAAADGFPDLVGLPGKGFTTAVSFLPIPGSKVSKEAFEQAGGYVQWGNVDLITDSDVATFCETAGCVRIGSFANSVCGVEYSGIAGRLVVPNSSAAKKVAIRLRVLVAGPDGGSYDATSPLASPLSIELARPGSAPVDVDVDPPNVAAIAIGAAGFTAASAWMTTTLALPAGDGDLGYAVRAGASYSSRSCGSSTDASLQTAVLIDSIAVQ